MLNFVFRLVVGALFFVAFMYVVPLFLNVIKMHPDADLWALVQAALGIGVVVYAIWGKQGWPWGPPP